MITQYFISTDIDIVIDDINDGVQTFDTIESAKLHISQNKHMKLYKIFKITIEEA